MKEPKREKKRGESVTESTFVEEGASALAVLGDADAVHVEATEVRARLAVSLQAT